MRGSAWPTARRRTVSFELWWRTCRSCAHREVTVEAVTRTGWIRLILPDGWVARIDPSSTNTSHISNKAADAADPDAPAITVTGHPVFGYIKIRRRRRR